MKNDWKAYCFKAEHMWRNWKFDLFMAASKQFVKTKGQLFPKTFSEPGVVQQVQEGFPALLWGEKLFHNKTQFSCCRLQNASALLTLCQLDNLTAAWFFMRLSFSWRRLPGHHFTGNSQCKVRDTDGGAWLWPGVVHIHPSNAGNYSQGCCHITKHSF